MPRAGRWLWEARRSGRSDGSNDVQDLSMMGHVVVVGSPYHTVKFNVSRVFIVVVVLLSVIPPGKYPHDKT